MIQFWYRQRCNKVKYDKKKFFCYIVFKLLCIYFNFSFLFNEDKKIFSLKIDMGINEEIKLKIR